MGMIFSPSGTPVLLQLEPAEETLGWTGQILGDDLSSILILPTKWGVTAEIHSQMHGSFQNASRWIRWLQHHRHQP